MSQELEVKRNARFEALSRLARNNFYLYCRFREPDFYKKEYTHLKLLCDTLNDFYFDKLLKPDGTPYHKLNIKCPPQHGKSRTLVNFSQFVLGYNSKEIVLTASYGDAPATDFSRYTRDGINEEKNFPLHRVFSDVFPETKIKRGNSSVQKWALEGRHFSYLGCGVGGAVTGKGGTIKIIDDLVKDASIAVNDHALEKLWLWFSGTFNSRNSAIGKPVKHIFCATPWSEKDPQARLEKLQPDKWYNLEMEVYNESTGEMLCDDLLSKESYMDIKEIALQNPVTHSIFMANYHNKRMSIEGRLYKKFLTYKKLDFEITEVRSKTDTADTGKDNLCHIAYVPYNGLNYVINVIYTPDPNEITESLVAEDLKIHKVNHAMVESNNGGRGFARAIERITREKGNVRTIIDWFHQSGNKQSRIKTNSTDVQNTIVYPEDWAVRWPAFFEAITTYMANGENSFDDGPDTLTMIVEDAQAHDGLIEYDKIEKLFKGDPKNKDGIYLTCNVSKNIVHMCLWSGFAILEYKAVEFSNYFYNYNQLRLKYGDLQTFYYSDAQTLPDGNKIKQDRSPIRGDEYKNVKHQMYFMLSDLINSGEIKIKCKIDKDSLTAELLNIRQYKSDHETKKQILPRDKIIQNLGRDIDLFNAISCRMFPVLKGL
jgi:predicted phage terminase large subunit-like protein